MDGISTLFIRGEIVFNPLTPIDAFWRLFVCAMYIDILLAQKLEYFNENYIFEN